MRYEMRSVSTGASRPRVWRVKAWDTQGRLRVDIPRACTISDLRGLFKRSARHLYRYVRGGRLPVAGKILGHWLVDLEAVERLLPLLTVSRRRLPAGCRWLFPEYAGLPLSPMDHAPLIAGRLLRHGGLRDVRWLLRAYPASWLKAFVAKDGLRTLTPKAAAFWRLWFRLPSAHPHWRLPGRRWGGAQGGAGGP